MTEKENELLTQVGPETSMGNLIRRYWIPACLSSELPEPDCPPVRVKLLCENLVAFRNTTGQVGLVNEFCAHRRASLFLGRNEEQGLRCVYHGWKYDVEGHCMDMPNEPPESNFKDKIRLKSYPTAEMGGIVWTYMGPRDKKPPVPGFAFAHAPEGRSFVSKTLLECNWLQGIEGGMDTSHVSILHRGIMKGPRAKSSLASRQEIIYTKYGFLCGTTRDLSEGKKFAVSHVFVAPFHQIRTGSPNPGSPSEEIIEGHIWVPMDDKNTMDYTWALNLTGSFGDLETAMEDLRGRGPRFVASNFRKLRNQGNDWMIDRGVQKTETFTGIEGINTQDHAVQESMGPITDRTKEHLGPADKSIIAVRRVLTEAVKAVEKGGNPQGIDDIEHRPYSAILGPGETLRGWLKHQLR
jgi:phthalate 4,5-dioxygenase